MALPYIIAAFYTMDPIYTEQIENLRKSLEHLNLPYRITSYPPFKSWQSAVSFKPVFIKEMIESTALDILYLDADARVNEHPALFDAYPHDIGVRLRPGKELFGATIYFKNNTKARRILDMWAETQTKFQGKSDQAVLQTILEREAGLVDVGGLPEAYCCKFDEATTEKKVIEQFQASRKIVNRRG